MPPPLRVTLDPVAQAELERRYHTTRDAETRTRYQDLGRVPAATTEEP
jgi:hypothetical protein